MALPLKPVIERPLMVELPQTLRPVVFPPAPVRADLSGIIALPGFEGLSPALLARGMNSWAAVFGLVSFELFGRLTNAIFDDDAWFDYQLRLITHQLGL